MVISCAPTSIVLSDLKFIKGAVAVSITKPLSGLADRRTSLIELPNIKLEVWLFIAVSFNVETTIPPFTVDWHRAFPM